MVNTLPYLKKKNNRLNQVISISSSNHSLSSLGKRPRDRERLVSNCSTSKAKAGLGPSPLGFPQMKTPGGKCLRTGLEQHFPPKDNARH